MALKPGGGKRSGKTASSIKRRAVTRRSGFSVQKGNTGGTYHVETVSKAYTLTPNQPVQLQLQIPQQTASFSGFGLWFAVSSAEPSTTTITHDWNQTHNILTKVFPAPNWSKLGSMWPAVDDSTVFVNITFESSVRAELYIYDALAGIIEEQALDNSKDALQKNMHQFAPEALFVKTPGEVQITGVELSGTKEITLKNCNRCARYLPININNERDHLSFSNHCTAAHKVPCQDTSFSKLRKVGEETPSLILENGFQLECRFCKKFYVNAPHNPRRSTSQMREDGTRRRAFELLVSKVTGKNPNLSYRSDNRGKELAVDVWERFDKQCFKCSIPLSEKEMRLDHTRPLAQLWPLDATATILCHDCNTAKRDRSPVEFYTKGELTRLSKITGLSDDELSSTEPNSEALDLLWDSRDWLFGTFFESDEFGKIRDGKDTRLLIIKALTKAASKSSKNYSYNFDLAYEDFRKNKN